jgi:adenylate cyclase
VALAPGRGDAHAARGIAHLASEEYEEAAIECDRAIELDPSLWKAYYNYARASYHQGQMEEALGLFEKAAKINGSDYQSPLLAAPIYKRLGDAENAEKSAREGVDRAETFLEDHPDNHRAFYLGAGALLDLGERKRAFEWARKALAIDPSDPSIRYNMGCFYAKAGEIDQAFEYLQDSITSRSWIEHDPDLDPIREDPRYQKLLESLE